METNAQNESYPPAHIMDLLELICAKWSMYIIMALAMRSHRFGELNRALPGISTKVLTQSLRNLERSGIISRAVAAQIPPRTDYSLTKLGEDLVMQFQKVSMWAKENYHVIESSREMYDGKQGEGS